MNFANIKNIIIPEGSVTKITDSLGRILWKKNVTPTEPDYFWVENISNDVNNVKFVKGDSTSPTVTLEYKIDNGNWNVCDVYNGVDVPVGSKIYFRGDNKKFCSINSGYNKLSTTNEFNVGGDITSLLNKNLTDSFTNNSEFSHLFDSCSVVNANNLKLSVKKLTMSCYYRMFYRCTSLIQAPELPATELNTSCYSGMFYGCTSLIQAPELPATELKTECYYDMFNGCTSLTSAQEIHATTLAQNCCYQMFYNCTSLTQAPKILPATTLVRNCYYNMFYNCTLLTESPILPATTLAQYCYYRMFYGCAKLNKITYLGLEQFSSSYFSNWVKNVAKSGTFIKNSSVDNVYGTSAIPTGWSVVEYDFDNE